MQNINKYNISVIGDSIAKGLYIKDGKIEKIQNPVVSQIEKEYNIIINNCSQFGQTIKKIYDRKIYKKIFDDNYDKNNSIVVIAIGGNDSDYNWGEVQQEPTLTHNDKTPLNEFKLILENIINYYKSNGIKVVVCSLFPISSKKYFNEIISKNFNRVIIENFLNNDIENLYRHQECYNNILLRTAQKTNCRYIDFRTPALLKINFQNYLSDDGIHPNQKGHDFIANEIINHISCIN